MSLVGRVVWRSGRRDAQRPMAVIVGGERREVEVVEEWVEGPAEAGASLTRGFVVCDGDGRHYRITARPERDDLIEVRSRDA